MPARLHGCPLCANEEAQFPSASVTLCDNCGAAIGDRDPRLLFVSKASYRTFCSPDCLKSYQTPDELYTKRGSTREEP